MAKKEEIEKKNIADRLKGMMDSRLRVCLGIVVFIFAAYLMMACISFFFSGSYDQSLIQAADPGDMLDIKSEIKNWMGLRGAIISDFIINRTFGVPSLLLIFFLGLVGIRLLRLHFFNLRRTFGVCLFATLWLSLLIGYAFIPSYESSSLYLGGECGFYMGKWFESQIGWMGTIVMLLTILLIFSIYWYSQTLPMLKKVGRKFVSHLPEDLTLPSNNDDELSDSKANNVSNDAEEKSEESSILETNQELASDVAEMKTDEVVETVNSQAETETKTEATVVETVAKPAEKQSNDNGFEITIAKGDEEDEPISADEEKHEETKLENTDNKDVPIDIVINQDEFSEEMTPYDPTLDLEFYKYPTLDLLKQPEGNSEASLNMEEQNNNKNKIVTTLENYGIKIDSIKATIGPTVTLYEIVPAAGIKISKIKNLENDIALSLAALGIRIIAPIPGNGTVGIEVPNQVPQTVPMRTVIASKRFQETKFDLPIAFGKTITNEVFVADLAKMPHLLVAGATGQGKSVGLNAIIASLLYKKHPSQLKFVMVDPKKVEFTIYSAIEKHFLAKLPDMEEAIVTDVTKVVETLNSLTKEMDTRYDLLKMAKVRNIKEYNDRFINRKLNPNLGHKYLPYIVVIIDEFGDLIMTAGKEVELPIARIAQLARAVGIHMVIATQRPTTNIITGTIKANFPARLAFRVASMIDSRTILDTQGANQLIGKGDMLLLQGSDLTRIQCAFVDTPEVERIAEYIGNQQGYPTAFLLPECDGEAAEGGAANADLSKLDPLFHEAAEMVVMEQAGSTSNIQRKFSIGFNRAGRLMDQLEAAGIVGPAKGSKPREVLICDLNDLEMRINNLKK